MQKLRLWKIVSLNEGAHRRSTCGSDGMNGMRCLRRSTATPSSYEHAYVLPHRRCDCVRQRDGNVLARVCVCVRVYAGWKIGVLFAQRLTAVVSSS